MPFIEEPQEQQMFDPTIDTPPPEQPGWLETFWADWRLYGPMATIVDPSRNIAAPYDTNYNPAATEDLTPWENDPDKLDYMLDAHNKDDFVRRQQHLQYIDQLRATSEQGPFSANLFGGMVGALTDPTSYIGAGLVTKGKTATEVAINVGKFAAIQGGVQAGQEVLQQSAQPQRTFAEGAINVAAGTTLAAMLGGAVAGIKYKRAKELADVVANVERDIANVPQPPPRRVNTVEDFLKREEGIVLTQYNDVGGAATIGYGHLVTAAEKQRGYIRIGSQEVPLNTKLTEQQAEILFTQDVVKHQNEAIRQLGKPLWDTLNDTQKAAITSYTYNTGTLPVGFKEAVAAGDMTRAGATFIGSRVTTNQGKNIVPVLVNRRIKESRMFLGDTQYVVSASEELAHITAVRDALQEAPTPQRKIKLTDEADRVDDPAEWEGAAEILDRVRERAAKEKEMSVVDWITNQAEKAKLDEADDLKAFPWAKGRGTIAYKRLTDRVADTPGLRQEVLDELYDSGRYTRLIQMEKEFRTMKSLDAEGAKWNKQQEKLQKIYKQQQEGEAKALAAMEEEYLNADHADNMAKAVIGSTYDAAATNTPRKRTRADILHALKSLEPEEFDEKFSDYLDIGRHHTSAGAAAVQRPDMTLVGGKNMERAVAPKVKFVKEVFGLGARLATSRFKIVRETAERLFADPWYRKKHLSGTASQDLITTAEREISQDVHKIFNTQKNSYRRYKADATAQGVKPISKQEFEEQVAYALRRGDVHANPHVEAAAKQLRTIYDDIKVQLEALGVELGDELYAQSYFTRTYDVGALLRDKDNFINAISVWFRRENPTMDIDEIVEAADAVWQNIVFNNGVADVLSKPKTLMSRVLRVPDEVIEPWLSNAAFSSAEHYSNQMRRRINFAKTFGDTDLKDVFKTLKDEANQMINATTDAVERGRIEAEWEESQELLTTYRDVSLGRTTFGSPLQQQRSQFLAGVRVYQTITKLGRVVFASLPDLMRPIMEFGLSRYGSFWASKIDPDIRNMSRTLAEQAGVAFENEVLTLPTRFSLMYDMDAITGTSRTGKLLTKAQRGFGKISLMSYWNNSMKRIAATMTGGRLIDTALAIEQGVAKQNDIMWAAHLGFDDQSLRLLAQEYRVSGKSSASLKMIDVDAMQDVRLKNLYLDGVRKSSNIVINTPNAATLPHEFYKEGAALWKTILQFKSFAMTAHQQTLVRGLQGNKLHLMEGAIAAVGLSYIRNELMDAAFGRRRSDDERVKIYDAIDGAGIVPLLTEFNNMAFNSTNGEFSLQRLMGIEAPPRRYASVNILGAALGPSGGTAQDIINASRLLYGREHTEGQVSSIRKLIPYQNLHILGNAFNDLENWTNEALGIKHKDKRGYFNWTDWEE